MRSPEQSPDKPDNPLSEKLLSGPPRGLLYENLENIPIDKIDKPNFSLDLSGGSPILQKKFESAALVHEFEERIAIAEYDGQQNTLQAQRIAYQVAFIVH